MKNFFKENKMLTVILLGSFLISLAYSFYFKITPAVKACDVASISKKRPRFPLIGDLGIIYVSKLHKPRIFGAQYTSSIADNVKRGKESVYPILLKLGPINIYSFGVFLALGFFIGAFYFWREGKNEFEEEVILDATLAVAISAFLGARLFYILSHFANFQFNPLHWVHFYLYPGFSFWGGVIGGLSVITWFAQRKKISFWRLADFLALGVSLGTIFGQIGCLLNGCTVGKLTAFPWGREAFGFLGKRHPVTFYDALVALLIFFVVWRIFRWIFAQRRQREGSAAFFYLILLPALSFPLEFLKEGELYFYNLALNQWVALFLFAVVSILGYRHWRSFTKDVSSAFNFFRQFGVLRKEKND